MLNDRIKTISGIIFMFAFLFVYLDFPCAAGCSRLPSFHRLFCFTLLSRVLSLFFPVFHERFQLRVLFIEELVVFPVQ